jgi:hypothetical protein
MQAMDFTTTNYSNLPQEILDQIDFGKNTLSDMEFHEITERLALVKNWVTATEDYIKEHNLERDAFSPEWGEHTQRMVADALFSGDRELTDRVRLLWWYTGWPTNIYTDARTYPVTDPVLQRYEKLKGYTPKQYQYAAPAIMGEAGWRDGSKIINHDVAIVQERIQFLHFSGVTEYLESIKNPMILELGTGYGGMSLAFQQCLPESRNILCDLPQTLAVAFAYLNAANPGADHYAVTTTGVYHVNTRQLVTAEAAFNKPGAFVYVPNYLLPAHEQYLAPSMIFNAMSLHEMFPKAIKYYCELAAKLTAQTGGIFCEVNTLPGTPNVAIDDRLRENFNQCLEVDFPSLAGRPRIWSKNPATHERIAASYQQMLERLPLNDLFEFVNVFESPVIDDETLRKMIKDQLGKFMGVKASILPPPGEPFMGNHLRYIVQQRKGARIDNSAKLLELTNELTELKTKLARIYASRSWRLVSFIQKFVGKARSFKSLVTGKST